MNNEVLKEWRKKKQELVDCIGTSIGNIDVEVEVLLTMREMLLHSKIKKVRDKEVKNGKEIET